DLSGAGPIAWFCCNSASLELGAVSVVLAWQGGSRLNSPTGCKVEA
ncbi:MAG: hypothetical protein QG667_688, partial [Pseudomonadota bacterium]|nr:hypothetical protein [Pseudomonadota bacterium]